MNLLMIRLVISALIVGSILVETRPLGANPLLLLISFDGFRWDYLHMHNLSNFNYLKSRGSHAEYIVNSFSTVTFPNHWTIATGLYEETHGIIENDMYDPVLNKTYNYVTASSQTYEWFGQNRITEPIWTTNQKGGNGRHSAAEWVGANVIFGNQSITYIPYSRANSYYDLIDLFIRLFLDEQKPINFGALYFDEPDHVGHMYGPYSKEMEIKLHELNDVLGYLLDELKKHDLFDRLNLIITSDHGMEKISEDKTIFLDSYIDTSLFDAHGSRACYSIFLKRKSDFDYVYETLKRIDAIDTYKKEEIPDMLKYKNNVRVGDILIVTKLTYAVYINNETINWTVTNGDHGYYNNESSMYPIFIAHGPAFKQNFESPVFNNVDIYPLMCYILQIIPAINNGSLENVKLMLSDMDHCEYITIFSLLVLTPLLTTASYFRFRKIKKENEENEEKSKCSNSKYSAYIKLPIVTGEKPINALFNNSRLIVDVESEWMKRQIYG